MSKTPGGTSVQNVLHLAQVGSVLVLKYLSHEFEYFHVEFGYSYLNDVTDRT